MELRFDTKTIDMIIFNVFQSGCGRQFVLAIIVLSQGRNYANPLWDLGTDTHPFKHQEKDHDPQKSGLSQTTPTVQSP